ncbi:hypothetical protein PQY76_00380 [bacterium]|nr:hypothetical protein [bacterium]
MATGFASSSSPSPSSSKEAIKTAHRDLREKYRRSTRRTSLAKRSAKAIGVKE